MQAWLADTFSDEEGKMVAAGKTAIIHGTKTEVMVIARSMAEVVQHLDSAAYRHMHLRDSMAGWSKSNHIDIEITVDERTA